MSDYPPIEIRGYYRAVHSSIWELADGAGILDDLNVKLLSMDFCLTSAEAESALVEGRVDFVSGTHISPYVKVARGEPIVCLASPNNELQDSLVTNRPIKTLSDVKGMRIVETSLVHPDTGYNHPRGNHMLYIKKAGLDVNRDVSWLELAEHNTPEFRRDQMRALLEGEGDAAFISSSTEEYEQKGLHVLKLDVLPMISGPTITTSFVALHAHEQMGERLVRALVRAIALVQTKPKEAREALERGSRGNVEVTDRTMRSLARLERKPYPSAPAVSNAHELCTMQHPETAKVSALALWDLHYLRELDQSGFIDALYE